MEERIILTEEFGIANSKTYKAHELTGTEKIEGLTQRKYVPVSLVLGGMRRGRVVFIAGLRKRTAFDFKKRLKEHLGDVDMTHVLVDGKEGYTFSCRPDNAEKGRRTQRTQRKEKP